MTFKNKNYELIIYTFAMALFPNIFLIHLHNNNIMQEYSLRYFFIFGAIMWVVSTGIFLLINIVIKIRKAMVITFMFWMAFWFYHPLKNISVYVYFIGTFALFAIVLILIYLIFVYIYLYKKHPKYAIKAVCTYISKKCSLLEEVSLVVFNTFTIVIIVIFFINFIPGVWNNTYREIRKKQVEDNIPYKIKMDFIVDDSLPHPDIYWFHMDGMMGFDVIEAYFGDAQQGLKDNLNKRGFVINESATLDAGFTTVALSAMLSPDFYESYLMYQLSYMQDFTNNRKQDLLYEKMVADGVDYKGTFQNLEIFNAFNVGGYSSYATHLDIGIGRLDMDDGYRYLGTFNNTKLLDFVTLLTDASLLSIVKTSLYKWARDTNYKTSFQDYSDIIARCLSPVSEYHMRKFNSSDFIYHYDRWLVQMFADTLSIKTPKFVFIQNALPHVPYYYNENGALQNPLPDEWMSFDYYLPQHKYSAYVMLNMIDVLIENNPNTVIVMQSDHGPPHPKTYENKTKRGYTHEDFVIMNSSTISAVRIPPQYGILSEPLNPLDISRWLINNFIGQNYDYLFYSE